MATATTDASRALTLTLLEKLLPEERSFAVRLWDGTTLPASIDPPRATLVLSKSDTLGRMLNLPLDVSVAEAYMRGDFEIEGEIEAMFEILETTGRRMSPVAWAQLAREAAALRRHASVAPLSLVARLRGRKHSRKRDRQAIQHHYDVSNRFHELFLDERMVYSCAYFPTGNETLDEAQEAKLELVCRKLRLKAGERLLDIGSGWGGLVIHAAERYGVQALGITVSEAQCEEARARVKAAGLAGRVRIELLDYRDVRGEFDKIASVGMAEHVGKDYLKAYFESAWDHLKPGGLMMNHAISQGTVRQQLPQTVISGKLQGYVFPDGEILPLWESLKSAEEVGFEVRDAENLREHYAKTLRRWVKNLETNWAEAVNEVGAEQARLRRFYFSAAAYDFDSGHASVHQTLLAKPDAHGRVFLPPSRADLYW